MFPLTVVFKLLPCIHNQQDSQGLFQGHPVFLGCFIDLDDKIKMSRSSMEKQLSRLKHTNTRFEILTCLPATSKTRAPSRPRTYLPVGWKFIPASTRQHDREHRLGGPLSTVSVNLFQLFHGVLEGFHEWLETAQHRCRLSRTATGSLRRSQTSRHWE